MGLYINILQVMIQSMEDLLFLPWVFKTQLLIILFKVKNAVSTY